MGRRALRKIDPSLDLSRYLKTIDQLPTPFDSAKLFDRVAPLEIEIGSGKGLFLASASGANPDCDFIGIEIARKYARFAAAKLARADRSNAVMIHGDATRLLNEILPDASVWAIHVYFPDPWWKKRHKKRRIMNRDMLRRMERTLQHGGLLHFWTDVEEYYQTTVELIRSTTQLTGPVEVLPDDPEHDLDYRTHFERRMRLHDEAVFRSEFRKT